MDRVLLIDDDVELCTLLTACIEGDGYVIEAVHDGAHGLERARSGEHVLIILDLMLPKMGGLEVLRRLRERVAVPVLILTARGEEVDRIVGLEIGADDYVSKPFSVRELIARIRAILRRGSHMSSATSPLVAGDIRLNLASREAWVQDREVMLTSVEFSLLQMLLRRPGQVVTREELTEEVLGRPLGPFDRVIDVHISNIRKKLGTEVDRIKPIRGSGYLFVSRSDHV